MSDPYVGEIRMVAFNFAPTGWAVCDGQILSISQNAALFSILGTTYGGNGTSNFALPNLQGNTPLGFGNGPGLTPRVLGETGGESAVTLTLAEMASHTHTAEGSSAAGGQPPGNNVWSKPNERGQEAYNATQGTAATMNANALAPAGGGVPHNNLMPYLVVNFVIAMRGVFPSRN